MTSTQQIRVNLDAAHDALAQALLIAETDGYVISGCNVDLAEVLGDLVVARIEPDEPAPTRPIPGTPAFTLGIPMGRDERARHDRGVLDDPFGVCAVWAVTDHDTHPGFRFGVLDHDYVVPAPVV